ncbi:hypothetical protein IFM89_013456 [Coptis chinensis]|uniref:Uncharacterized GPI-anchored protein At5g19230-like domain-containing protein n=1 Tax=Coptis chinensis TaxID=261450 RepID=A0A835HHP0_9MAGN|nr:hypothetical protein IFM89_013456 [Coptis chinensis]
MEVSSPDESLSISNYVDEEDKLLLNINSYRLSLRKPALAENDSVDCPADEIADQLKDQPCPAVITPRIAEA